MQNEKCQAVVGQFLTSALNSSRVPFFFRLLARQLITQMFPLTYPSAGTIRSRVGLLSEILPELFSKGMPSTGHRFGIMTSCQVMLKGSPSRFARRLAN